MLLTVTWVGYLNNRVALSSKAISLLLVDYGRSMTIVI